MMSALRPPTTPLRPSGATAQWSLGVPRKPVATYECGTSCRTSRRSSPRVTPLRPFADRTGGWCAGVPRDMVESTRNWVRWKKSKVRTGPLRRFWRIKRSSPGVMLLGEEFIHEVTIFFWFGDLGCKGSWGSGLGYLPLSIALSFFQMQTLIMKDERKAMKSHDFEVSRNHLQYRFLPCKILTHMTI